MKTKLLATTLLAVLCLSINAQITFQKTYGGISEDYGASVQQTIDGGYIIAGQTASSGAGNYDVYLIKTDANGDTLWENTYGGTNWDESFAVQQTSDSGYVVVGTTWSLGAGMCDVFLFKTDVNGNMQWGNVFGGAFQDIGFSVQQTADGGYIVVGQTESYPTDTIDVFLIKTDANGDSSWTRHYGGTSWDEGLSVQQTTDLGYIITGNTKSYGAGIFDVYLIKTDLIGDTLWTKTFGGTDWDFGNSVQQTADGGYIIAGQTASSGAGFYDVYLIKTDMNGDSLWTKTFGETMNDVGSSVQQTANGGYVIAGEKWDTAQSNFDVYLITTNGNGDTLWTKTYGGTDLDEGKSVWQTSDGGFAITGNTQSFGAGLNDVYFIKTDSLGNSPALVGLEDQSTSSGIFVYPNPFSSYTTLQSDKILKDATLTVYNLYGQEVRKIKNISGQSVVLFRDNLPSGVYFLHLIQDHKIIVTDKLVITDN